MFETQIDTPPEIGGIFLSMQEKQDATILLEKYEAARLASERYKAELEIMLPNPDEELSLGHKTYQAWVEDYVRQKSTYWSAQKLEAINILLPGLENATKRHRVKKAILSDPRETANKDRENAKNWLYSHDLSAVLASAGVAVEYEPPNPYLEMRIIYSEGLKERAAISEDVARTIRRKAGELRERIVVECKDSFASGVEVVSEEDEHRYFVGQRGYITEYDWEADRVIHYYDGQLETYDGHRNSDVTDDERMLGAVANASQITFISGKIAE